MDSKSRGLRSRLTGSASPQPNVIDRQFVSEDGIDPIVFKKFMASGFLGPGAEWKPGVNAEDAKEGYLVISGRLVTKDIIQHLQELTRSRRNLRQLHANSEYNESLRRSWLAEQTDLDNDARVNETNHVFTQTIDRSRNLPVPLLHQPPRRDNVEKLNCPVSPSGEGIRDNLRGLRVTPSRPRPVSWAAGPPTPISPSHHHHSQSYSAYRPPTLQTSKSLPYEPTANANQATRAEADGTRGLPTITTTLPHTGRSNSAPTSATLSIDTTNHWQRHVSPGREWNNNNMSQARSSMLSPASAGANHAFGRFIREDDEPVSPVSPVSPISPPRSPPATELQGQLYAQYQAPQLSHGDVGNKVVSSAPLSLDHSAGIYKTIGPDNDNRGRSAEGLGSVPIHDPPQNTKIDHQQLYNHGGHEGLTGNQAHPNMQPVAGGVPWGNSRSGSTQASVQPIKPGFINVSGSTPSIGPSPPASFPLRTVTTTATTVTTTIYTPPFRATQTPPGALYPEVSVPLLQPYSYPARTNTNTTATAFVVPQQPPDPSANTNASVPPPVHNLQIPVPHPQSLGTNLQTPDPPQRPRPVVQPYRNSAPYPDADGYHPPASGSAAGTMPNALLPRFGGSAGLWNRVGSAGDELFLDIGGAEAAAAGGGGGGGEGGTREATGRNAAGERARARARERGKYADGFPVWTV